MPRLTRRQFVGGSAAAAAALSTRPSWARVGPRCLGDEIRVGVVGVRSRGRAHVNGFQGLDGVRVAAVCDVDEKVLGQEVERIANEHGVDVDAETDIRRLLERDDIDVVAMATPNHWHALGTIWACEAGKDVYIEKPVSHDVWEGRQMIRAARKHGRIVQAGTQSRSSHGMAEAIEWLHEGELGAITLARGLCYKPRRSIGKVDGPQTVPDHIDYDLWTGPARKVPLLRRSLHYDWHWVFENGNGDLGNQGVHQVDQCRWALGELGLPRSVVSMGGRLGYDDDGNTPNTQVTVFDYETAPLVFEVRGLPRDAAAQREDWGGRMDRYEGVGIGSVIHCEGGSMRIPTYNSAIAYDADGAEIRRWEGSRSHFANFIEGVRSREVGDLACDIEEGHVSSALCHLANISYRVGTAMSAGEVAESIQGSPAASEAFGRMREHLAKNEVDVDGNTIALGPWLEVDATSETFRGNEQANRYLRRAPREPFAVPEVSE